MSEELRDTDHLVIGSGAGGALTAAHLAEAGERVLVLEEGDWVAQGDVVPFGLEQMERQYRNAGMTAALGRPPIAYAEGCCAGGGTEVNSGLYHRAPPELLARWRETLQIDGLEPDDLAPHADAVEAGLSIQPLPGRASEASCALARGADALGWQAQEVPRWFRYDGGRPEKQSMTRTYLPRATTAGAELECGWRVEKLTSSGGRADGALAVHRDGRRLRVRAGHVWVCGGAVGTPALLQRSGAGRGVGATLRMHPTVKLAARFADDLDSAADVPVHQVKEFGPDLSFGGSASRPGFVALAMGDDWAGNRGDVEDWAKVAVYYAAIRSEGVGRVRTLPGLSAPLVTYRLTARDLALLRSGLLRLAHLLLAAGADTLYPSLLGAAAVRSADDVPALAGAFTRGSAGLMTVHLTSTVPLGERADLPADSYGRLRALRGVTVNDASLLPEAPGVNPQGTVMALASRNVERHLAEAA